MSALERGVLIAGGGIGGLAASIAFGARNIASTVLERSRFADETGAGIQLGPNATRALRGLGVLDAVAANAVRPDAIWLYDAHSGLRLNVLPLGRAIEQRHGAPYLTLHRADLHAALLAAAESYAAVALQPGFAVSDIGTASGEIIARTSDGAEVSGSCLIGADGLWSTVRKFVAPQADLQFAGATAWRALVPTRELPAPFDAPVVGLVLLGVQPSSGARSYYYDHTRRPFWSRSRSPRQKSGLIGWDDATRPARGGAGGTSVKAATGQGEGGKVPTEQGGSSKVTRDPHKALRGKAKKKTTQRS